MAIATSIAVRVPRAIRRRPRRNTRRADPGFMKAMARVFRYQRMQDEGRFVSISEIAADRFEGVP